MKNGIGLLILIATLVLSISGGRVLHYPKPNPQLLSPEKQIYVVDKFRKFDKCNGNTTQIANKFSMRIGMITTYKTCEDKSDMCLFRCVLQKSTLMIDGDLEASTFFHKYFDDTFKLENDVPRRDELKKHYLACHKEKAGTTPFDTTCTSTEKFFDCFVEKFDMVCDSKWKKSRNPIPDNPDVRNLKPKLTKKKYFKLQRT